MAQTIKISIAKACPSAQSHSIAKNLQEWRLSICDFLLRKKLVEKDFESPLVPGGPLAVAMMTGDFDLSGIGTVTHIEDNRVYGWGHPFLSSGACEFPLLTGFIHTVSPRQTVSFKMGSPLRTVGVINADVSTCVAGWLGRKPDMMPMFCLAR